MAFSFVVSQAHGHECLGECAKEKSQKQVSEKADHSCCEGHKTPETSEVPHSCEDSHCLNATTLNPAVFSFLSYPKSDDFFQADIDLVEVELDPLHVLTEASSAEDRALFGPRFKNGLYIVLKRLRFC